MCTSRALVSTTSVISIKELKAVVSANFYLLLNMCSRVVVSTRIRMYGFSRRDDSTAFILVTSSTFVFLPFLFAIGLCELDWIGFNIMLI